MKKTACAQQLYEALGNIWEKLLKEYGKASGNPARGETTVS